MPEDNHAIVLRFEEAFSDNDVVTIDELCDPNLVDHNPFPGQGPGLAGFKETIAMLNASFPDGTAKVEAVISDGEFVATRWITSGTHEADFFGVEATHKHVAVEGMNFYRLSGGRITEVWSQYDGLGLMQQLGALH
jgi:steroid delta-isomerase-like uncharacterized protein